MCKIIDITKNTAAYQVRRSAVKNIQSENNGIARKRHAIPAKANNLGSLRKRRITNKTTNPTSCIFINYILLFFIAYWEDVRIRTRIFYRRIKDKISKESGKYCLEPKYNQEHSQEEKWSSSYRLTLKMHKT